jgi:hypothetical protein
LTSGGYQPFAIEEGVRTFSGVGLSMLDIIVPPGWQPVQPILAFAFCANQFSEFAIHSVNFW